MMDGLNVGLSEVSRAARWALMLVIAATSELTFIAMDVSVTKDLVVLYRGMWLSALVLVAACVCMAWLHQPERRNLGSAIAGTVTLAGVVLAAATPIGGGMAMVLALVGLITIWRGRHLYSGKIVSLAHTHFAADTAAFIALGGYFGLSLMSQTVLLAPLIEGLFVLILLCDLAGWLFCLWSIERSATFSHGANRGGLAVMLLLAAVVGLFGLPVLKYTAFAIFAAFGVAFIPLVQKPLNIGITMEQWNHITGRAQHVVANHQWKAPPRLLDARTFHLIALGLGIAALIGLVMVLRRTRPSYVSKNSPESAPIEVVHRRKLTGDGDPFLKTQDPTRLRVQQWLKSRLVQGHRWTNDRTVRQLAQESAQKSEVTAILAEYEAIRYGRNTDA